MDETQFSAQPSVTAPTYAIPTTAQEQALACECFGTLITPKPPGAVHLPNIEKWGGQSGTFGQFTFSIGLTEGL
jgi:hypothetical protein